MKMKSGSSRAPFVEVEIVKVCFGCEIEPGNRVLISALVKATTPRTKLVQLKRRELDKPLDTFAS